MIKAGILGSTGYTGVEVLRLLERHPSVHIEFATARSEAGKRISDITALPLDLRLQRAEDIDLSSADVLFLCVPHGNAQEWAQRGLDSGAVVIDLSADHRLADAALYRQWYGEDHQHPSLLTEAVYGLTEWRRAALRKARLVANPGCYPTSILLAVAPLLSAGLLADATIIADSKSGASGGGRSPQVGLLFAEVNENLKPYNVGHTHRHVAEMEQELSLLGGCRAPKGMVFSPHLLPITRGIVSTIYVPWPNSPSPGRSLGWGQPEAHDAEQLHALYQSAYADQPFVTVLAPGQTATLAHSVHSNRCTISLHPVPERNSLIVVSTIDNLLKGAAGQAVQNMNVRFGLSERAGLN
jgi:N-acetyl-gamma-glutamyl-phosphate reductase